MHPIIHADLERESEGGERKGGGGKQGEEEERKEDRLRCFLGAFLLSSSHTPMQGTLTRGTVTWFQNNAPPSPPPPAGSIEKVEQEGEPGKSGGEGVGVILGFLVLPKRRARRNGRHNESPGPAKAPRRRRKRKSWGRRRSGGDSGDSSIRKRERRKKNYNRSAISSQLGRAIKKN